MKLNQGLYNSVAPAGLIALFMCLTFRTQYAHTQEKLSDSPKLNAQPSEQAPAAQDLHTLRDAWAHTMHHTPAPKEGCFETSYPSTQWQEVPCDPPPGNHTAPPKERNSNNASHEAVGGSAGNDLVAQAPSGQFFATVTGKFLKVRNVTSETGVGGQGILGPNEYMLQVNTNFNTYSNACGTYAYCAPWVQFLLATNTFESFTSTTKTNKTQVYIEYWLLNYGLYSTSGPNTCPSGFVFGQKNFRGPGINCLQNTAAKTIYNGQIPITDLADLSMSASAAAGGYDQVTATYKTDAKTVQVLDSYTDIASVWNQAEFNVLGNNGGSEAQFNDGTALILETEVTYGSAATTAPTCKHNAGTSGESNNLNFVPSTASPLCCYNSGANPWIQFMEVYDTKHTHTASCGGSSIIGEPHITTVNDVYYNFQAAGEFVALLDSNGTEIQTRQTPLSTLAPGNYDPGDKDNDGLVSCLAMNTAVAARVGSHRVTYEPSFSGAYGSGAFDLRIDGKVKTLGADGVNLGDGARVRKSAAGKGIEMDFPDGKILTAIPSGSYDSMHYLNVQFEHTGLVGDGGGPAESGIAGAVPKGSWLPALPTGASVGSMPATLHERYETLYGKFADAWRVTSKDTLFDYAPGTSTATFTNTEWPVENAKTCAIPKQPVLKPVSAAVAKKACRSVSNEKLHASCLFDVKATGDIGFAATYKASERAHAILDVKPIDAKLNVAATK
jgi:hypothetical protein